VLRVNEVRIFTAANGVAVVRRLFDEERLSTRTDASHSNVLTQHTRVTGWAVARDRSLEVNCILIGRKNYSPVEF